MLSHSCNRCVHYHKEFKGYDDEDLMVFTHYCDKTEIPESQVEFGCGRLTEEL